MKLTENEVQKIAKLVRLSLSKNEVKKYQKELSAILDYVAQLKEVNTKNIEETSQVTGLTNIKRADEVDYHFSREEILSSAPETEENHLKVKNIF
ncbi:MAG: Asp-tRNA(Asn)/Glu-tRNA(Gln) amidotransferase subunit GatC [Patescibacteria group bacterium]|jgi:aspartyl-tRNA(Asn)/glutamyl-tRNA(Gln) amidotransferase subunit C